MGQAANSFLQGLMGGAQFANSMYSQKAEREWQKTQQDWKTEDRQREEDLRNASANLMEGQQDLKTMLNKQPTERQHELSQRYKDVRQNVADFKGLPKEKKTEAFQKFVTDFGNDVAPELVNQGNGPGEHKYVVGGEAVPGGVVPIIQVKDDNGKEIRRGPLTQNRSSDPNDKPLYMPTSDMVDMLVTSKSGKVAIEKQRKLLEGYKQDIVRSGGKLAEPKELYGEGKYDKYGNYIQKNLVTNKDIITKGMRGEGASGATDAFGNSFLKNDGKIQELDTFEDVTVTVGGKNESEGSKEVMGRRKIVRVGNRVLSQTYVDGVQVGKSEDVTEQYLNAGKGSTGGGKERSDDSYLRGEDGGAAAAQRQPITPPESKNNWWYTTHTYDPVKKQYVKNPTPESATAPVVKPVPAGANGARQQPLNARQSRARTGQRIGEAGAALSESIQNLRDKRLSTKDIKKAKQLAKEGKWDEVEKMLPEEMVQKLKKLYATENE